MEFIRTLEEFDARIGNGKHVVVISADWCGDCIFIKPFLPDIEAKFSEFCFSYVDRNELLDLCVDLNVFGIPSFLVFVDGVEVGRFVSKDRKTQAEIEEFIGSIG